MGTSWSFNHLSYFIPNHCFISCFVRLRQPLYVTLLQIRQGRPSPPSEQPVDTQVTIVGATMPNELVVDTLQRMLPVRCSVISMSGVSFLFLFFFSYKEIGWIVFIPVSFISFKPHVWDIFSRDAYKAIIRNCFSLIFAVRRFIFSCIYCLVSLKQRPHASLIVTSEYIFLSALKNMFFWSSPRSSPYQT